MNRKKTITVQAVVDAVGALSRGTLEGNIYLFDNNRLGGSTGEGTQTLTTKIGSDGQDETVILWNVMSLDPEAYIRISDIMADGQYIEVAKQRYKDSDIEYWTGIVKKAFDKLSYRLSVQIGSSPVDFSWDLELAGN